MASLVQSAIPLLVLACFLPFTVGIMTYTPSRADHRDSTILQILSTRFQEPHNTVRYKTSEPSIKYVRFSTPLETHLAISSTPYKTPPAVSHKDTITAMALSTTNISPNLPVSTSRPTPPTPVTPPPIPTAVSPSSTPAHGGIGTVINILFAILVAVVAILLVITTRCLLSLKGSIQEAQKYIKLEKIPL